MDQDEERKKKARISKQRSSLNGRPFIGDTETLEGAQNDINN